MLGFSLSASPSSDADLSSSARGFEPTIGNSKSFSLLDRSLATSEGEGGQEFAKRLEAALDAVRSQIDSATAGKVLPGVALATQPLGESSELITPDDGAQASEEALYALALAQGLEPGVVAAVLWPRNAASLLQQAGEKRLAEPDAAAAAAKTAISVAVSNGVMMLGPSTPGSQSSGVEFSLPIQSPVDTGRAAVLSTPGPFALPSTTAASLALNPEQSELKSGAGDLPQLLAAGELKPLLLREKPSTPQVTRTVFGEGMGASLNGSPLGASIPGAALANGTVRLTGEGAMAQAAGPMDWMAPADGLQEDPRAVRLMSALEGGADGLARAGASGATTAMLTAAHWALRQQKQDLVSGIKPQDSPNDSQLGMGVQLDLGETPTRVQDTIPLETARNHHSTQSNLIDLTADSELMSAQSRTGADREAMQQKLSEALAQRMVAQVNRGQWSLQIELKPADLGSITIDMSVRNGQLDAVFDAANAPARALIVDGLDRLRQELERSGMNVANLGMQNTSGGSSGGKPTPGRPDRRPDGLAQGGRADHEDTISGVNRSVRHGDHRGLDLLV